jgi:endonuclease/exonuclease/phosphatase family metal-dependent hydrolase
MRTVRVVTLNIWNRSGPWQQRLAGIRAGLAEIAPDIVGLQEVLRPNGAEGPDQAQLIAEGLGYQIAYGPAFDSGGIEFGNAALSKFPIVRAEVLPLPQVDTDEQRCLLFAELDAPIGKIPFFVTHLNWRFHEGHVREAQVMAIAEHVKRLAPISGFPPIIVGDFNAAPEADEIRFMKGLSTLGGKAKGIYFADTFGIVGRGDGTTFSRHNPFASDLREPDRRIDYIFVRGPDGRGRGEPLDAHVCFDRPIDGVFPSDHFGVSATIRAEV